MGAGRIRDDGGCVTEIDINIRLLIGCSQLSYLISLGF